MTVNHGVRGHCPACGGETLLLGDGGHIVCCRLDCPRPTAADELLDDHETEHVVLFAEATFTVRHPLRERLDDALMTCRLHDHIADLDGPPVQPGRYRARPHSTGSAHLDAIAGPTWAWERLPDVAEVSR